jgi:hypothetical protein
MVYSDTMPPPWYLIIYALAVMRVTGLITTDTITEPLRDKLTHPQKGWLDQTPGSLGHWLSDLITCQWCMSRWVATPTVFLVWHVGDSPGLLIPATILALSQVTGMFSHLGR